MLPNVPIVVRFGIIDRGVNTIVFSRRDRRHMTIVECGEFRHPRESQDRGDGSVHFVELSYSASILVNKGTQGWTCAASCGTQVTRNCRSPTTAFWACLVIVFGLSSWFTNLVSWRVHSRTISGALKKQYRCGKRDRSYNRG